MDDADPENFADQVNTRAVQSVMLLVGGIGVAMIPFLGTMLMLLVGWIPLLLWVMGSIDPYFHAVRLHRRSLRLLAGFSLVVPIAVYGFHVWVVSHGP